MKVACCWLAVGCALAVPASARAQDDQRPKRVEVGAALEYAAPVGSVERGARVSDTTFAAVALRVDAAYVLATPIALAAGVAYAPAIPTLCKSASDCESSLGSDVTASLGARVLLPRLGATTPRVDFGVGYEWLTTRLSDAGVVSTRAYDGPLLAVVEAAAPFRLSRAFTLGPTLGATLGIFAHESLEASGVRASGSVHDRALHAWLGIGVRLGFAP